MYLLIVSTLLNILRPCVAHANNEYILSLISAINYAVNYLFGLFKQHREKSLASMCNQAIMLITDGVTDKHINIFERENWKNGTDPPFPVRMFTYLIGRDNTDSRGTKWMACANQGYYVQLNTIPEVKEQVFNYMNVLARPLVLKSIQKFAWTPLYAHRIVSIRKS